MNRNAQTKRIPLDVIFAAQSVAIDAEYAQTISDLDNEFAVIEGAHAVANDVIEAEESAEEAAPAIVETPVVAPAAPVAPPAPKMPVIRRRALTPEQEALKAAKDLYVRTWAEMCRQEITKESYRPTEGELLSAESQEELEEMAKELGIKNEYLLDIMATGTIASAMTTAEVKAEKIATTIRAAHPELYVSVWVKSADVARVYVQDDKWKAKNKCFVDANTLHVEHAGKCASWLSQSVIGAVAGAHY